MYALLSLILVYASWLALLTPLFTDCSETVVMARVRVRTDCQFRITNPGLGLTQKRTSDVSLAVATPTHQYARCARDKRSLDRRPQVGYVHALSLDPVLVTLH